MFNAAHDRVDRATQEGDFLVEFFDQFAGLVAGHLQLIGELALTHAVHQPKPHCFGLFTIDVGHIGHHLVKVRVGVVRIGLDNGIGARQAQEACIVNQEPWFLSREVI